MAESSGFFNAVSTNGTYDRSYLAEDFAGYFENFIGNGIWGGSLSQFQATVSGRVVTIAPGKAFIKGYWYELTEAVSFTIPTDSADKFFDVYIRLDLTSRSISLILSDARPATTLVPIITRNETTYDLAPWIVVARVNYPIGFADFRGNNQYCGLVTGLITQIDTTAYQVQLNEVIENAESQIASQVDVFETWIANQQTTATSDWNAFKAQANTLIDGGQDSIQQQIADFDTWITQQQTNATTTINGLIQQLQDLIDSGDVSSLVDQVNNLTTLVNTTNTALNGKMDKLPNATVGTNLAVGVGGNAASTGRVSIDAGTAVGGVLAGTMPNPGMATVPQNNTSSAVSATYGQTIGLLGNVAVGISGRLTGKQGVSLTLPDRPFKIQLTEEAAQADMSDDWNGVYE